MRAIPAGLLLGAGIAIGMACSQTPAPRDPGIDKRNEIGNLWIQIRQWRSQIPNMPLDPPATLVAWVGSKSVRDLKAKTCPVGHHVPTTCNDVCSISENICDNAERICDLAHELGPSDDYAQQKCTSAKASCKEATQRCCACSDKPVEPVTAGAGGS